MAQLRQRQHSGDSKVLYHPFSNYELLRKDLSHNLTTETKCLTSYILHKPIKLFYQTVKCSLQLSNIDLVCMKKRDTYIHTKIHEDLGPVQWCYKYKAVLIFGVCVQLYSSKVNVKIESRNMLIVDDKADIHKFMKMWLIPIAQRQQVPIAFIKNSKCVLFDLITGIILQHSSLKWRLRNMSDLSVNDTRKSIQLISFIHQYNIKEHHNVFICKDRTVISRNRVCDNIGDCLQQEDEASCDFIDVYQVSMLYHICGNGSRLPISKLCDYILDCDDDSDEKLDICFIPKCNQGFRCRSGQCIHIDEVSDSIFHCIDQTDEYINILDPSRKKKLKKYSDQRQANFKCSESEQHSFGIHHLCIYMLNSFNQLYPCEQGNHLEKCNEHKCTGYFKCPNQYCLPVRYVCDGREDCLLGEDELNCPLPLSCPGMMKCRESICIPMIEVCDGVVHCPSGDDERMCSAGCPSTCKCNGLSWTCDHLGSSHHDENNSPKLSPLYLRMFQLNIKTSQVRVAYKEHMFYNVKALYLTGSGQNQLYFNHSAFRSLKDLDISLTGLTVLYPKSFAKQHTVSSINIFDTGLREIRDNAFLGLSRLHNLTMRHQFLHVLENKCFLGLDNLKYLDLSYNKLNTIKSEWFKPLKNLLLLDIDGNGVLSIDRLMYFSLPNIQVISTSELKLCCLPGKDLQCQGKDQNKLKSCQPFKKYDKGMASLKLCFSIAAVLLNSVSLAYHIKAKLGFHTITFLFLNSGYILHACALMVPVSAAILFNSTYVFIDLEWRSSFLCKFIAFIVSTMIQFVSIVHIFLARDKYMIVKYPIQTKARGSGLKGRLFILLVLLTILIVCNTLLILVFSTVLNEGEGVIASKTCVIAAYHLEIYERETIYKLVETVLSSFVFPLMCLVFYIRLIVEIGKSAITTTTARIIMYVQIRFSFHCAMICLVSSIEFIKLLLQMYLDHIHQTPLEHANLMLSLLPSILYPIIMTGTTFGFIDWICRKETSEL